MTTYDIGDRRKLSCELRNESGVLTDPDELKFKIRTPDNVVTTYIYGSNEELERDSVGKYYVYWDCTQRGDYFWRYEATGIITAAEETMFSVRKSVVNG